MPRLSIIVEEVFKKALQEYVDSRNVKLSDYVRTAIIEKAEREGKELPAPVALDGYRKDQIPEGWKSRLYEDKYQLVIDVFNERITHLHQYVGSIQGAKVANAERDGIKAELYLINLPVGLDEATLSQEISLILSEQLEGVIE
jgi:hypothetical protein